MSDVETFVLVEGEPMDAGLQPAQSEFQGAFRAGPKATIVIDMPAALEIAQGMVQAAADAATAKVDSDYLKAMRSDDAAGIAAAKQRGQILADAAADPRLTSAATPDALLAAVEAIISEF